MSTAIIAIVCFTLGYSLFAFIGNPLNIPFAKDVRKSTVKSNVEKIVKQITDSSMRQTKWTCGYDCDEIKNIFVERGYVVKKEYVLRFGQYADRKVIKCAMSNDSAINSIVQFIQSHLDEAVLLTNEDGGHYRIWWSGEEQIRDVVGNVFESAGYRVIKVDKLVLS